MELILTMDPWAVPIPWWFVWVGTIILGIGGAMMLYGAHSREPLLIERIGKWCTGAGGGIIAATLLVNFIAVLVVFCGALSAQIEAAMIPRP